MLSGVAKFTTIITIMVVTCECLEAARDTIDNGSIGVGPKTNNTKTIPDSKPAKFTTECDKPVDRDKSFKKNVWKQCMIAEQRSNMLNKLKVRGGGNSSY